jgi:hypothetical protein
MSEEQLILPFWASNVERGIPNSLARSALFGMVKRGAERKQYKDELIASYAGTEILYTGEALNQQDLDLWLELVDRWREVGGGDLDLSFTRYGLCKMLGKRKNAQSYQQIKDSLKRLRRTDIEVNTKTKKGRIIYNGGLIHELGRIEEDERTEIRINMNGNLAKLFGGRGNRQFSTQILDQRRSLKGDLSKWLYGYIITHRTDFERMKPHWIKLDKLKNLSGSTGTMKMFKFNLKKALEQLVKAAVVKEWEINERGVMVVYRREELMK